MFILPYDTESKSRNVLASPLGEEGHEVAKGCTRVRMIMILDVDVTAERRHYNTHRPAGDTATLSGGAAVAPCASLRSGGSRLAVRTAMEHPIGALPRTPFPASRDFPSRGNERYEEKNRGVICFMYYSSISPFGGWRHHLARWEACHWIRGSRGSPMNPVPLPPPLRGGTIKLRYAVSCL